jgi:hypothetical protein
LGVAPDRCVEAGGPCPKCGLVWTQGEQPSVQLDLQAQLPDQI